MRDLIIILLIILCVALGYFLWKERATIRQLEAEIAALKAKPREAPNPRQRIMCPLCHGECRLMSRRPDGRDVPYVCPVCAGVGYRELVVTAGYKLCPDCSGMGMKVIPSGGPRVDASRCMRCHHTGLVRETGRE